MNEKLSDKVAYWLICNVFSGNKGKVLWKIAHMFFKDLTDNSVSKEEEKLLRALAKKCTGKGVIVEIGSWKGKSTIQLGKGSKAGNKVRVYAVDPHTGSFEHKAAYGKISTVEEFKKNIKNAKVDDVITPIVKTSDDASKDFDRPVELVFIDGCHDYESVKQDFELWFPKVISKGTVALHDTLRWPGPKRVAKEKILNSKKFKNITAVDSIIFAEKI